MNPAPKRRWLRYGLLTLVAAYAAAVSCGPIPDNQIGDGPIPPANEVVMSPGMKITATTPQGSMTIVAGDGLKRSFTWEGETRSVEMLPREKRWFGSLGLYFPGPGDHWKTHNGISRGVVQEGQQHFKSVDAAMKWIAEQTWNPIVYRNDGLAVGWRKNLERSQLNVDVWQIYINGEKPTKLPESADDRIVVEERPRQLHPE